MYVAGGDDYRIASLDVLGKKTDLFRTVCDYRRSDNLGRLALRNGVVHIMECYRDEPWKGICSAEVLTNLPAISYGFFSRLVWNMDLVERP